MIWVTYGRTESGDDLDLLGWKHLPTTDEVEAAYRDLYPDEYDIIGFVNWKMSVLTMVE